MTSTNDGKDEKSDETSAPKSKSYYIELYKSLDASLSSACGAELAERVCAAWRALRGLCAHSLPSTHAHYLAWIQRQTARTLLQTEWSQSEGKDDEHKQLEDAINAFIGESRAERGELSPAWQALLGRAEWFLSILRSPWGHPVLRVLLDPSGDPPTDDEVVSWLRQEQGAMVAARVRTLAAARRCQDLALRLAAALMDRARGGRPPADTEDPEAESVDTPFVATLKQEAGFTKEVWDLLMDIEFVLLYRGDKRSKCIELAKQTSFHDAHQVIERLQARIDKSPEEKKVWKNCKEVAILIAQVTVARCMVVPVCGGAARAALFRCGRALARLLGARLPAAAAALAAPAATARHLHTLAAAVRAQVEDAAHSKPFVCELFVRALTAGVNELERLKLHPAQEGSVRLAQQQLAAWLGQLGALLAASARLRCECALTAFSLHPAPALLRAVQDAPPLPAAPREIQEPNLDSSSEYGSWATDSRSQTNFVKTSETLNLKQTEHQANVLSTAILSEGETLGLSPELCQDIAVLLSGPRLKTLSWDMDRQQLLSLCRAHAERTRGGAAALGTELRFLRLDPRTYAHLPEEADPDDDLYYGIEKGYEHLVDLYQEPEEIWQDGFDPERTDSVESSSDIDAVTTGRKKKNKKHASSSEDSDSNPLSVVAEAKRGGKKKERPHSKERSKERTKDRSKPKPKMKPQPEPNVPPQDPLAPDDPEKPIDPSEIKTGVPKEKKKRERKKKDGAEKPRKPRKLKQSLDQTALSSPLVKPTISDREGLDSSSLYLPNSEVSGSNVEYDGIFSMNELRTDDNPDTLSLEAKDPVRAPKPLPSTKMPNNSFNVLPNPNLQQKAIESAAKKQFNVLNSKVKNSITKLLQFRREKAMERDKKNTVATPSTVISTVQKIPNAIMRPQQPLPSHIQPKVVAIPEIPKVVINKTQSNQITELKNEVNHLLNQQHYGIQKPVIQYAEKSNANVPTISNLHQERYSAPYRPQQKATNLKAVQPQISKTQNTDTPAQKQFYEFLQELQNSINAGVFRDVPSKEESKGVPISPAPTNPDNLHLKPSLSAKQPVQQKKPENTLNTFSRLSYMHKNSKNDLKSKSIEASTESYRVSQPLPQNVDQRLYEPNACVPAQHNQISNNFPLNNTVQKPKTEVNETTRNHAILSNILQGHTSLYKVPSRNEIQPQQTKENRSRHLFTPPKKASVLSEQDEEDSLKLLQQQNEMRSKFEYTNAKVSLYPPSTAANNISLQNKSNLGPHQTNKIHIVPPSPSMLENINPNHVIPKSVIQSSSTSLAQTPLNKVKGETNRASVVPPQSKTIKTDVNINNVKGVKSNVSKKQDDWRNVLDILRSHNTPNRGPNALEMALTKGKTKSQTHRKKSLEPPMHETKTSNQTDIPYLNSDATYTKTQLTGNIPINTGAAENLAKRENVAYSSQSKTTNVIRQNSAKDLQPRNCNLPRSVVCNTQKKQIQAHGLNRSYGGVISRSSVNAQKKQFASPMPKTDDPFISGIPNSDYDLLDELIDDDLRQEIGELSDDESYVSLDTAKELKKFTAGKGSQFAKQQDKRRLNSLTTTNKTPTSTGTKCKNVAKSVSTVPSPHTSTNSIPSKIIHNSTNTQNNFVHHYPSNVIIAPNNAAFANNQQINTMQPSNSYVTAVPQQQNVLLIGPDLIYQPSSMPVQNQIQSNITGLAPNAYVSYSNQPNMTIYQTTQFAAPVVSPCIIGNATICTNMIAPVNKMHKVSQQTSLEATKNTVGHGNVIHDADMKQYAAHTKPVDVRNDTQKVKIHAVDDLSKSLAATLTNTGRIKVQDVISKSHATLEDLSKISLEDTRTNTESQVQDVMSKHDVHSNTVNVRKHTILHTQESSDRISKLSLEVTKNIEQEKLKRDMTSQQNLDSNLSNTSEITSKSKSHSSIDKVTESLQQVTKETVKSNKVKNAVTLKQNVDSILSDVGKITTKSKSTSIDNVADSLHLRKVTQRTNEQGEGKQDLSLKQSLDFNPVDDRKDSQISHPSLYEVSDWSLKVQTAEHQKIEQEVTSKQSDDLSIVNDRKDKTKSTPLQSMDEIPKVEKSGYDFKANNNDDGQVVKDVQDKISEMEKVSKDQDRINKKRIAIINRTIHHRCYYEPIPLIYAPLKTKTPIAENRSVKKNDSNADSVGDKIAGRKNTNKRMKDRKKVSLKNTQIEENPDVLSSSQNIKHNVLRKKDIDNLNKVPNPGKKSTISSSTAEHVFKTAENTKKLENKRSDMIPVLNKVKTDIAKPRTESDVEDKNLTNDTRMGCQASVDKPCDTTLPQKKLNNTRNETSRCNNNIQNNGELKESLKDVNNGQSLETNATSQLNDSIQKQYPKSLPKDKETNDKSQKHLETSSRSNERNEKIQNGPTLMKNTAGSNQHILKDTATKIAENGNKKGTSENVDNDISSIPQSFKDSIIIEHLPNVYCNDPLKKCIRIKLPNGRVFKATIHGQVHVDFDTLFSDPKIKDVLLSNLTDRKRYTLNIKQVSMMPEKSRVQEVKIKSIPNIQKVENLETINLLSDEEEDVSKDRCLKTEFGEYKLSSSYEGDLANHQKRFHQKSLVKLNRNNQIDEILSQLKNNELTANKFSLTPDLKPIIEKDHDMERSAKVAEIITLEDDSSNDLIDLSNDDLDQVNVKGDQNINVSNSDNIVDLCNDDIDEPKIANKINKLKDLLFKDLGLSTSLIGDESAKSNITCDPTTPLTTKSKDHVDLLTTQAVDESVDKIMKLTKNIELSRQPASCKKCYVKLMNCDHLVEKYVHLKYNKDSECASLIQEDDDKVGNKSKETYFTDQDLVPETVSDTSAKSGTLSRAGSFSILNDFPTFDLDVPIEELERNSSPVIDVFEVIASLNIKTDLRNHVTKTKYFFDNILSCQSEWHATKLELNMENETNRKTVSKYSNNSDFDLIEKTKGSNTFSCNSQWHVSKRELRLEYEAGNKPEFEISNANDTFSCKSPWHATKNELRMECKHDRKAARDFIINCNLDKSNADDRNTELNFRESFNAPSLINLLAKFFQSNHCIVDQLNSSKQRNNSSRGKKRKSSFPNNTFDQKKTFKSLPCVIQSYSKVSKRTTKEKTGLADQNVNTIKNHTDYSVNTYIKDVDDSNTGSTDIESIVLIEHKANDKLGEHKHKNNTKTLIGTSETEKVLCKDIVTAEICSTIESETKETVTNHLTDNADWHSDNLEEGNKILDELHENDATIEDKHAGNENEVLECVETESILINYNDVEITEGNLITQTQEIDNMEDKHDGNENEVLKSVETESVHMDCTKKVHDISKCNNESKDTECSLQTSFIDTDESILNNYNDIGIMENNQITLTPEKCREDKEQSIENNGLQTVTDSLDATTTEVDNNAPENGDAIKMKIEVGSAKAIDHEYALDCITMNNSSNIQSKCNPLENTKSESDVVNIEDEKSCNEPTRNCSNEVLVECHTDEIVWSPTGVLPEFDIRSPKLNYYKCEETEDFKNQKQSIQSNDILELQTYKTIEKSIERKDIKSSDPCLDERPTLTPKDDNNANSNIYLKGVEYEDPEMGTCYVFFPVVNSTETDNLSVEGTLDVEQTVKKVVNDEEPELELKLNIPKITYSRKHTSDFDEDTVCNKRNRKNLKRKINMNEVNTNPKKYRKGKGIDYPKITVAAMAETSYGKQFKNVFDYISSLSFSYSIPFNKDHVEVDEVVCNWPLKGTCQNLDEDVPENHDHLFRDAEYKDYCSSPDRLKEMTLAEEIDAEDTDRNFSSSEIEINETNFNMGFGERSGRVIQNLKDVGDILKYSAATLSDVKQSQPLLLSENNIANSYSVSRSDEMEKLHRNVTRLQLREKVKTFFRKTSIELKRDSMKNSKNDQKDILEDDIPFGLNLSEYMEPLPAAVAVCVVQLGQRAQNPAPCDPRVTPAPAGPALRAARDPHAAHYTELTTASLSLPLQDYAHHNHAAPANSQEPSNAAGEPNPSIETEIKSIVKIELVEELPEELEHAENGEHIQLPSHSNNINHVDYTYPNTVDENNSDTSRQKSSEVDSIFSVEKQPESEMFQQQKLQNGSSEKTDQIAHAMNAAGITTTAETITNTRAQALVNILSQKMRQNNVAASPTGTNTYSKTTSINAMSLQQALAQILPPPLNQTNNSENNQQTQNSSVAPQVLHIVQGKNASGNQITLVENPQQSVINNSSATPVLHIVQNKGAANTTSNGNPAPQTNSFSGLSLVDAGLQQGGNQLLHIVNTGNQKNAHGQLLKRVNLLTNLTNVQGSNEQKMVQFLCKSADGKSIQLNAPHQRSMVLRLQPVETPNMQATQPKPVDSQDISSSLSAVNPTQNKDITSQQEIKSRSVYEENYAKFIQNSSNKTVLPEKSTSLPKFGQAFGKQVFQDGNQKQNDISNGSTHLSTVNSNPETVECQSSDNAMNLDHMSQISSPPLLLRKSPAQTSQAQPTLVQQLKQTIAPMNMTMHGGVIYTRQIPVNIGPGQTINLITVPSTELIDDSTSKPQNDIKFVNQGEMEPSIIKIVPQTQPASNADAPNEENNSHITNENTHTPQPVLTQMRIKLPMLSKTPQMVAGARVVRPSFFQIQRNVISGGNQPVYQQLVLTAAPPLGQQTIRLPTAQTRQVKVPTESQSSSESQMSSSTLEQLREFDLVLEQVKERSTVQPNASNSTNAFAKIHTSSTDTTDGAPSASATPTETTQQVLYSIGNNQPINVAYVRKPVVATPSTSTFARSPDSSGIADSPSSSSHIPHTVTSDSSTSDAPAQSKPTKVSSKSKSRPKASSNPPNTLKLNPVPPKPSTQKPLEDEQTTQRILYILAEYKEQVENSPDKDKPAPRRRSNPPSNPGSSKRKKSSSGSRRPGMRDMSPVHGEDTCRTMGSEDSSCGTSQGDCNESCIDSHSPQDSPRKIVRKLTFEQETVVQPRPQPQRNVIVADGQTITVARGTAGKPATAVLMPANYILPVSMVKGGQQIAIVTNRGPKLLTVGGGEGGTTNALLLQRLIGPAGLKPVLTRPGVRHVRLPTTALHNLQTFNLATTATVQPPDSTASPGPAPTPDLVDTRATSSPWADREEVKPERGSSPEGSEPWNLPSSADNHDYSYEDSVRADNLDRTVLDTMPDRYSPDMEAQRIFDKMFDVDSKKSYMVDSHVDSPRCGYDIDASDCDDKAYHQVVQKKDGSQRHRLTHVSAAALRHKYAILEHELRLQKSLSEECSDLGVDSPSAAELFPEAELLFAASPAHDSAHHDAQPQPNLLNQSGIPHPDIDDQIATDQLLTRSDMHEDRPDLNLGLEDVGIVTVSEDGMQATLALDQEEFARAHPNTTFHSEPTDDGEVQPFTLSSVKSRQITSTIFQSSRPSGTVLVPPQPGVAPDHVKYDDVLHSLPTHSNVNLASVLVKDDGLARFDTILNDSRELHLTNTASAIVHGHATQVIRRVRYEDTRDTRFLMDESDAPIAGDDAKMCGDDSSGASLDGSSSPERHAELFWESNSTSERSSGRRPLDFSSDSDKCCKSPSLDENNSTDSSGLGAHVRLDSVIKEARGASGDSDEAPPLRTYPAKRLYRERSLSGKTRPERPVRPDGVAMRPDGGPARHDGGSVRPGPGTVRPAAGARRRAEPRGCHCCSGEPPTRPKRPRQRKHTLDFTTTH